MRAIAWLFASPSRRDSGPRSRTKSFARPFDREHAPARSVRDANPGPERAATLPAATWSNQQERERERESSEPTTPPPTPPPDASLLFDNRKMPRARDAKIPFREPNSSPLSIQQSSTLASARRGRQNGGAGRKGESRKRGRRSERGSRRPPLDDRRPIISLLSSLSDEATASRRSLRLFSPPRKGQRRRDATSTTLSDQQKKHPCATAGGLLHPFFPYLGLDGRLGCLFGVHGQLASVLLLDGPETPPVVALGSARGREAREGFLGLAHDFEKGEGRRWKRKKKLRRSKRKKGSEE